MNHGLRSTYGWCTIEMAVSLILKYVRKFRCLVEVPGQKLTKYCTFFHLSTFPHGYRTHVHIQSLIIVIITIITCYFCNGNLLHSFFHQECLLEGQNSLGC